MRPDGETDFLRAQATRCRRLATQTDVSAVQWALFDIADQLEEHARLLDALHATIGLH